MTETFQIKFLYSGTTLKDIPPSKVPEFVLVGRSNVGKSSLLNALAGQKKLAYVSQTPGRTKTINIFSEINNTFYITDLPGYGFSKSSRDVSSQWAHSIKEYFEKRKNIISVIFLVDIRRDILLEDRELVFWFKSLGFHVLCVQTKCDKVSKDFISKQKKNHANDLLLNQDDILPISVHKKIGIQALCTQFTKMVNLSSK